MALGQHVPAAAAEVAAPAQVRTEEGRSTLEEIVVTATRREQNIHDVPSSMSALDQESIERQNLVGMGDYLNTIPGVSMQDMGAGRNSIIVRGIGISELDRDVTGVYFGEVPLTSLAYFGNADIKLVDMSRVEILRAPQGTLYGAGAMGGAIRSIPAPPDTGRLHGKVSLTYSETARLGSDNSGMEAVVNVPLVEDKLAVRAVGYRFRNSGFYENLAASDPAASAMAAQYGVPQLAVNKRDIGNEEYTGGRLALMWKPTEQLTTTLTYLNQELVQNGFPELELNLDQSGWAQARLQVPPLRFRSVSFAGGAEQLSDDLELANLTVEYDFGSMSLLSSTSWVQEYAVRNLDNTQLLGFTALHLQGNGAEGWFQEARLSSKFAGPLQFIAGAYYENIDKFKDVANEYSGSDAANPFGTDRVLVNVAETTGRDQRAVFGELSYSLTDQITATAGARFSDYQVTFGSDQYGIWTTPGAVFLRSDQSEESYKFNLSYRPAPDKLLYAQLAQGFRLGYPQQPFIPPTCDMDDDGLIDGTNVSTGLREVKSDTLDSFEIGSKVGLFGNRVALDAAIFQAEWSGMPVFTGYDCNAEVTLNLGKARSRGAELSIAMQLAEGLRGDVNASYTDAEVEETVQGLGIKGQRLPGSPRYAYNLGLQYDFDARGIASFVQGNLSYRGEFFSDFTQNSIPSGDYYVLDMRGGVSLGNANVAVFVKNLTNSDEFVWVSQLFADGRAYRMRPRTIGLELAYRFGAGE